MRKLYIAMCCSGPASCVTASYIAPYGSSREKREKAGSIEKEGRTFCESRSGAGVKKSITGRLGRDEVRSADCELVVLDRTRK